MKSKIVVLLFFLFWIAAQITGLLWPFTGKSMSIAGTGAVFFLSSVPFALLAIWLPPLRVRQFWIAYSIYLVLAVTAYFYLGKLCGVEYKVIYIRQGLTPLILNLLLLLFFFIIVAAGLVLKRTYDNLDLCKGARDREELENYYEMKARLLPEGGLTPFRYKQLLNISVSFTASRFNQIRAAIHLLPYENEFFFYDLVHAGLAAEERERVIPYLLTRMMLRPEVRLNKPEHIVYVVREPDQIWDQNLRQAGFAALAADDPRIAGFYLRLQGLLEIEFDGWVPFSETRYWYLYSTSCPEPDTK